MELYIIGIDLAKEVFQLHGANKKGHKLFSRKIKRSEMLSYFKDLAPCRVVMEACGGSNYWARTLRSFGHIVQQISPQHVKPFVRSNKNDKNDAAAIVTAALQPDMRFIGAKSVEQQDIQTLHRVRSRLVSHRTAIILELKSFLLEFGIALPKTVSKFKNLVPDLLENESTEISMSMRETLQDLYGEYLELDRRVKSYDKKITFVAETNATCQSLLNKAGIGALIATALYAETGDPRVYKNGRQFAASLGLVPRHTGSGGKVMLQKISKRGNKYLRSLMVHGARSIVSKVKLKIKTYDHSDWISRIEEERGFNKACVALANKNARWAWHVLMGH